MPDSATTADTLTNGVSDVHTILSILSIDPPTPAPLWSAGWHVALDVPFPKLWNPDERPFMSSAPARRVRCFSPTKSKYLDLGSRTACAGFERTSLQHNK